MVSTWISLQVYGPVGKETEDGGQLSSNANRLWSTFGRILDSAQQGFQQVLIRTGPRIVVAKHPEHSYRLNESRLFDKFVDIAASGQTEEEPTFRFFVAVGAENLLGFFYPLPADQVDEVATGGDTPQSSRRQGEDVEVGAAFEIALVDQRLLVGRESGKNVVGGVPGVEAKVAPVGQDRTDLVVSIPVGCEVDASVAAPVGEPIVAVAVR